MSKRRNQHVLFYKNVWCVHPEGSTEIIRFNDRTAAIVFAKAEAERLKTEAIVHQLDGTIETAWVYAIDAFPQVHLLKPESYPARINLGEEML